MDKHVKCGEVSRDFLSFGYISYLSLEDTQFAFEVAVIFDVEYLDSS